MLLDVVKGHDAEIMRGGEFHDVVNGNVWILVGDKGTKDVPELLQELSVALAHRLVEDNEVVTEGWVRQLQVGASDSDGTCAYGLVQPQNSAGD
jgi:hypothetical protein